MQIIPGRTPSELYVWTRAFYAIHDFVLGHLCFMHYPSSAFGLAYNPPPSSAFNSYLALTRTPLPPTSSFNLARACHSPVLGLRPRIQPFPQSSSFFTHAITRVCIYIFLNAPRNHHRVPTAVSFLRIFEESLDIFLTTPGPQAGVSGRQRVPTHTPLVHTTRFL